MIVCEVDDGNIDGLSNFNDKSDHKHRQLEDMEGKTLKNCIYRIRLSLKSQIWNASELEHTQTKWIRMQTICAVVAMATTTTTTPLVKACSVDCRAECANVAKAPWGEQLPN